MLKELDIEDDLEQKDPLVEGVLDEDSDTETDDWVEPLRLIDAENFTDDDSV